MTKNKQQYFSPESEVLKITLGKAMLNNASATFNRPFDDEQDWSE